MKNPKIASFKIENTFPRPAGINYGRGLVFERYLDLSDLENLRNSFEDSGQSIKSKIELDLTYRRDLVEIKIQDIIINVDESWDFEVEICEEEDVEKFRKLMQEDRLRFGADDGPKYEIVEK